MIGAAVVLVVAAFLVVPSLRTSGPGRGTPTHASVAALPLRNISTDRAESEHLAEGLGQTLATKLTQISGLRVAPWMTSRRYHDSDMALDRIAREMNVDALVIGTFQRTGERIRGNVALVDAAKGTQVWSDDFDEPLQDLFGAQSRIAVGAATRLLGKLSGRLSATLAKSAGKSVEAYEHYLKGAVAMHRGDEPSANAALEFFRKAVRLDPFLAMAHAGIGSVHSDRYFFGWGGFREIAEAEAAYLQALQIDPALIAARRGMIRVWWERGQSEKVLEQGKIVADSGATDVESLLARAEAYTLGGLERKGIALLRRVMEIDPGNAAAGWFLVIALSWSGAHEEAIRAGEEFLRRIGDDPEAHFWMAFSYASLGDVRSAEGHFRRSLAARDRGIDSIVAFYFRKVGRDDEAERILLETLPRNEDKVERFPDNHLFRLLLSSSYAFLGDIGPLRELEERVPVEELGRLLADLGTVEAMLGDRRRAVALWRLAVGNGTAVVPWLRMRELFPDGPIEEWPGGRELLAEEAASVKRLEALY